MGAVFSTSHDVNLNTRFNASLQLSPDTINFNHNHNVNITFHQSLQWFFYGLTFFLILSGLSLWCFAIGNHVLGYQLSMVNFIEDFTIAIRSPFATVVFILTALDVKTVLAFLGLLFPTLYIISPSLSRLDQFIRLSRAIESSQCLVEDHKLQLLALKENWILALQFPSLCERWPSLPVKISSKLEESRMYQESLDLSNATYSAFAAQFGQIGEWTLCVKCQIASAYFGLQQYSQVRRVCDESLVEINSHGTRAQQLLPLRQALLQWKMMSFAMEEQYKEALEVYYKMIQTNSLEILDQIVRPPRPAIFLINIQSIASLESTVENFNDIVSVVESKIFFAKFKSFILANHNHQHNQHLGLGGINHLDITNFCRLVTAGRLMQNVEQFRHSSQIT